MNLVIEHQHYIHSDPEVAGLLRAINRSLKHMATDLSRITAEVAEMSSAADMPLFYLLNLLL